MLIYNAKLVAGTPLESFCGRYEAFERLDYKTPVVNPTLTKLAHLQLSLSHSVVVELSLKNLSTCGDSGLESLWHD